MSDLPFTIVLSDYALQKLDADLCVLLESVQGDIKQVILDFAGQEVTPESTFRLEEKLEASARESMRIVMQFALNQLEGDDPEQVPKFIYADVGRYRRENQKTASRTIATRFGEIELCRFRYRYAHRESEPSIFPLESHLGLVAGVTPALADTIAHEMADTGASQGRVLEKLKCNHNVSLGPERLRKVTSAQAEALAPLRHQFQVAKLVDLLQQAHDSSGKRKPVMAVGRDGITVCHQPHGFYEVASVGTITVYDRSGKRLDTVYLARMPESLQGEMSRQLKRLIVDVLKTCERPLPRLCYVTDAGDNETAFFHNMLQHLRDPRDPTRRLKWIRIVDYYHAAERITTMATSLFGKGSGVGFAWARRMRKLLKKQNGPNRVLRSAAAVSKQQKMSKTRQQEFETAYNYIRSRTKYMQYATYSKRHFPIGSGVTEAACKTVFTQRLKLSGMRWKTATAQAILDLRTILLSGIWTQVRDANLQQRAPRITVAQCKVEKRNLPNAA